MYTSPNFIQLNALTHSFQTCFKNENITDRARALGPFLDPMFSLSGGNTVLQLVKDLFPAVFLYFYCKWMYPQTSILLCMFLSFTWMVSHYRYHFVTWFFHLTCFSASVWLRDVTLSHLHCRIPTTLLDGWIYHNWFFHSLIDAHLGGFRLWTNASVAAVKTIISTSLYIYARVSSVFLGQ